MESFIECDKCGDEFNHSNKIPKLLPKCGHTICLKCISEQNILQSSIKCP